MIECAEILKSKIPNAVFFVTQSPNVKSEVYDRILNARSKFGTDIRRLIPSHSGEMYELVASLDFALIASGTATLEAALIGTPYFLLYKASWSTYELGKRLVRVPYLGMVNLLSKKSVVPEFIQTDILPEKIANAAFELLNNKQAINEMKNNFSHVKSQLGEKGAGKAAATVIHRFISR